MTTYRRFDTNGTSSMYQIDLLGSNNNAKTLNESSLYQKKWKDTRCGSREGFWLQFLVRRVSKMEVVKAILVKAMEVKEKVMTFASKDLEWTFRVYSLKRTTMARINRDKDDEKEETGRI
ncbi:hypothetical protein Tco_1156674 [Tanacetum coccineum]